MTGAMKRSLSFLIRLILLWGTASCLAIGQGQVSGKEITVQISRLEGVTYKTVIHEGDLRATSGNESVPIDKSTTAIVPKSGKVDLIEAAVRAKKYAGELLHGKLDAKPSLWRMESAGIKWVSSDEGLGYYLINFQPRTSAGMVHDGAVDMLSVVVLFSGEILRCEKAQ